MKFAHTLLMVTAAVVAATMAACGNNTPATATGIGPGTGTGTGTSSSSTSMSSGSGSMSSSSSSSSTMTTVQSLDTAAVLAQARQASETGSPYGVNNGALTLTDTSDTTQPINAN